MGELINSTGNHESEICFLLESEMRYNLHYSAICSNLKCNLSHTANLHELEPKDKVLSLHSVKHCNFFPDFSILF